MAFLKPLKVHVGLTIPTHQGDLRVGDVLGEGSFGRVFRGSLNNKKVAIKAFNGSARLAKGQASNEYANLEIVGKIAGINAPKPIVYLPDYAVIVMELVEGTLLTTFWSSSLTDLLPFLQSILQQLVVLSGAGYVHRDIKPANLMVSPSGKVVFLDWGLLAKVNEGDADLQYSTPFRSPHAFCAPADGRDDIFAALLSFLHLLGIDEMLSFASGNDEEQFAIWMSSISAEHRQKLLERGVTNTFHSVLGKDWNVVVNAVESKLPTTMTQKVKTSVRDAFHATLELPSAEEVLKQLQPAFASTI